MTQTNYPVGQWIGWNGGECPVHPLTKLDVKFRDGSEHKNKNARLWRWHDDHDGTIIAFRIVEPYVEPAPKLECWVNVYPDGGPFSASQTRELADARAAPTRIRCVRMVEADG